MFRAGSQVLPPSVVRENQIGSRNACEFKRPSMLAREFPPFAAVPPAQVLKCGNVSVQDAPPLWETAVTRPCAPPSDHRSCCQTAITLSGFAGLTSTHGSSSAFG